MHRSSPYGVERAVGSAVIDVGVEAASSASASPTAQALLSSTAQALLGGMTGEVDSGHDMAAEGQPLYGAASQNVTELSSTAHALFSMDPMANGFVEPGSVREADSDINATDPGHVTETHTSSNDMGLSVASIFRAKRTPCRFFEMGQCFRGAACTFEHDPDKIAPKSAPAEEPKRIRNPLDIKAQVREYRHATWHQNQKSIGLLNNLGRKPAAIGLLGAGLGSGVDVENGAGFMSFDSFSTGSKD